MQCDSISPSCMDALVQLPKILSQEEQEAYENAIRAGNGDLLNNIHNGAGNFYYPDWNLTNQDDQGVKYGSSGHWGCPQIFYEAN